METPANPAIAQCVHCRRTRSAEGAWEDGAAPETSPITHGLCPACAREHYPDVFESPELDRPA